MTLISDVRDLVLLKKNYLFSSFKYFDFSFYKIALKFKTLWGNIKKCEQSKKHLAGECSNFQFEYLPALTIEKLVKGDNFWNLYKIQIFAFI